MSIAVAPITREHIEGFHATLDAVARERMYLALLEAPPIEETRKFVGRNIARGYPHFVALDGVRVVGWCDVMPIEREVLRHCGVLGIGLLPAYRGRGIGEQLMRETLQAARAFGLTRIELSVRDDNPRAIALYAAFGFQAEGRKARAFLLDGAYHDLVAMALLFDADT